MFSCQAVKISTLISCLSAAVILDFQTAAAQSMPQPAGEIILRQCEKELARDLLKELSPATAPSPTSTRTRLIELLTGENIVKYSYKTFTRLNTIKEKDVVGVLQENWLGGLKTVAPRITSIMRSKSARASAVVGMLVGGVMVYLGVDGKAIASSKVGSSEPIPSTETDFVVPESQPTDKTADPVISAPMGPIVAVALALPREVENTIHQEFGDKSKLAIWFAEHSMATKGDVIFSRLQACSDEKEANPERARSAAFALQVCFLKRTMLECMFEQEPEKNTLKNILSKISVNNGKISWDPRKFEGD